jgi:hypothetical protein
LFRDGLRSLSDGRIGNFSEKMWHLNWILKELVGKMVSINHLKIEISQNHL